MALLTLLRLLLGCEASRLALRVRAAFAESCNPVGRTASTMNRWVDFFHFDVLGTTLALLRSFQHLARRGTTPTAPGGCPARLPRFLSWASTGGRAGLATSTATAFPRTFPVLACTGAKQGGSHWVTSVWCGTETSGHSNSAEDTSHPGHGRTYPCNKPRLVLPPRFSRLFQSMQVGTCTKTPFCLSQHSPATTESNTRRRRRLTVASACTPSCVPTKLHQLATHHVKDDDDACMPFDFFSEDTIVTGPLVCSS